MLGFLQIYGKNQKLFESLKKEVNTKWTIIKAFLISLCAINSWILFSSLQIPWKKQSSVLTLVRFLTFRFLFIPATFNYVINSSFDCNPPADVIEMFLDISKAFDRVQHDELIHKIMSLLFNSYFSVVCSHFDYLIKIMCVFIFYYKVFNLPLYMHNCVKYL